MERREHGVVIAVAVASMAATVMCAPSLYPKHTYLVFWICVTVIVIGLSLAMGLTFITVEKVPRKHQSTTAKASGRGSIDIDGMVSTADTFADAQDDSTISARGSRHTLRKSTPVILALNENPFTVTMTNCSTTISPDLGIPSIGLLADGDAMVVVDGFTVDGAETGVEARDNARIVGRGVIHNP